MKLPGLEVAASETPFILTIDIGTSSIRAFVYDARGRDVPGLRAQAPTPLSVGQDGSAEIDPGALLAAVAECLDAVLAQAGSMATAIAGVAVDTLATSLMAVDSLGQPLTPLMTYADTRAAADGQSLRATQDESAVHDRTGCRLNASYWPARLAWLKRTRPDLWRVRPRWLTIGEYLDMSWLGRARLSLSSASWTGLLDRRRLEWDLPWLEFFGLDRSQLSELVDVDSPLVGLRQDLAERWPALRHVPWFPAISDGAAANIGSGCQGPERIALTLGSTGALRLVLPEPPVIPMGLWCYRVDRRLALVGSATSEGGNLYAWLRQTLQFNDVIDLEAALAAFGPDSHGLTVLPFIAGERGPGWGGHLGATLQGVTLATTPVAILRAAMEAVAFRFAQIWESLKEGAAPHPVVVASGNALRHSPAWAQVFADVLGQPIVLSGEEEATSRGAAVLALRALGVQAGPALDGAIFHPVPDRTQIYAAAIARQEALYRRLRHESGADPSS